MPLVSYLRNHYLVQGHEDLDLWFSSRIAVLPEFILENAFPFPGDLLLFLFLILLLHA